MVDQVNLPKILINDLPSEIIDNILSFLPFTDLCTTQKTSKVFHVLSDSAQLKKDEMIKKIKKIREFNEYDRGLCWAARIGDKELIKYFSMKILIPNWIMAMKGAAKGGHKDLVELFIKKGANLNKAMRGIWNYGMYGAARGGHKDLVLFFMRKLIRLPPVAVSLRSTGIGL